MYFSGFSSELTTVDHVLRRYNVACGRHCMSRFHPAREDSASHDNIDNLSFRFLCSQYVRYPLHLDGNPNSSVTEHGP
jgi:hypothetical protein